MIDRQRQARVGQEWIAADAKSYSGVKVDSPMSSEIASLFSTYGRLSSYQLKSGEVVTLLPSCTKPLSHFDRSKWAVTTQMGNVRSVRSIDLLQDGIKPLIVAKTPERVLTAELRKLEYGTPWWGGRRSGEKAFRLVSPIVEQQSLWEALILLELNQKGIKAEVPQAVLTSPKGERELLVSHINTDYLPGRLARNHDQILKDIAGKTKLTPQDSSQFNFMVDLNGDGHVIDVNRWVWKPYTDSFRARLIEELRVAAQSVN